MSTVMDTETDPNPTTPPEVLSNEAGPSNRNPLPSPESDSNEGVFLDHSPPPAPEMAYDEDGLLDHSSLLYPEILKNALSDDSRPSSPDTPSDEDDLSDHNPPPPPEILSNEDLLPDRIGNSIYSKRWLYKTLMSILQACDSPPEKDQEVSKVEGSVSDETAGSKQNNENMEIETSMIELDPKIEEDACTLWDMSATADVARFLNKAGVPSIIVDIMEKTKSPRLLEIMIGILGNMSSFSDICPSISENEALVNCVLQISGSSDTPTLMQVFRVIRCGIENQISQPVWFEAFCDNPNFFHNLKFILENSLNCDAIMATFQILYHLLKDQHCKVWGEEIFLKSVIEGGKQLLKQEGEMHNFFSVLVCLCQFKPNVDKFVDYWTELNILFNMYFLSHNDEEPLPEKRNVAPIFSSFEAYNTILTTKAMKPELITIDLNVLRSIRRLAIAVNTMVINVRRDNMEQIDIQNPVEEIGRKYLRRYEIRNGMRYEIMMSDHDVHSYTVLGDTIVKTGEVLKRFTEDERAREILEEIANSGEIKGNIGVLII